MELTKIKCKMNAQSKRLSRILGITCFMVTFLVFSVHLMLSDTCCNEKTLIITNAKLHFSVNGERETRRTNYIKDEGLRTNSTKDERLRTNSTEDKRTKCMGIMKRRFPTAIIAGVTKGGTTALTKFLNAHPWIAARYAREENDMHTAFFHHGKDYINSNIYHYRDLMPCSYSNQITIERSPAYFNNKGAAARIRRFNPKMKIIIIVKDPIIRTHSHYLMWRRAKTDNCAENKTFEECVTKENKTKVNGDSPLVYVSRYSQHIRSWLKNFSPDQILILEGKHFVLNPVSELNKVEDFLGIEHYFTENMFAYSKENGMYCLLSDEGTLDCMKKGKGKVHPPIQGDVKSKLEKYFRPLNNKFFKQINRTFEWGY